MWLRGSIYKENKTGPKIEPLGTPRVIEAKEETISPIETKNLKSDKYVKKHYKAVSHIPTHCWSHQPSFSFFMLHSFPLLSYSYKALWVAPFAFSVIMRSRWRRGLNFHFTDQTGGEERDKGNIEVQKKSKISFVDALLMSFKDLHLMWN